RAKWIKCCQPSSKTFSRRLLEVRVSRSSFDVREFPQVRVANAGGPLAHEETTVLLRNESDEPLARCARPCAEVRELIHAPLLMSGAKRHQRTNGTFGLAGRTYKGAEFHQ